MASSRISETNLPFHIEQRSIACLAFLVRCTARDGTLMLYSDGLIGCNYDIVLLKLCGGALATCPVVDAIREDTFPNMVLNLFLPIGKNRKRNNFASDQFSSKLQLYASLLTY